MSMLSTVDNPYNPFTDFDKWFNFDVSRGYNSCAYLARIAKTSDELPDSYNQIEIERAIDEIVAINVNGMFCKVLEEKPSVESEVA
jgi:hypothetical protein